MFHITFDQIVKFDWLPGEQKTLIFEKLKKKIFSETIMWMMLILCIHMYIYVTDSSLYINCAFNSGQILYKLLILIGYHCNRV